MMQFSVEMNKSSQLWQTLLHKRALEMDENEVKREKQREF